MVNDHLSKCRVYATLLNQSHVSSDELSESSDADDLPPAPISLPAEPSNRYVISLKS